jgi:outer membrane protein
MITTGNRNRIWKMNKNHHTSKNLMAILTFCLFLVLETRFTAYAVNLSEVIPKTVHQKYSSTAIAKTRKEMWKSRMVYEVKIITQDRINYEVIPSEDGKILRVEEEKGLPLIGGGLSLGLGVRGTSEIYKEVESEIGLVPYFNYKNGPLEITGHNSIDVNLRFYLNTYFSAVLIGSLPMDEGYNPDDSDYLEGMDELHTLYSFGLGLEWSYAGWEAGLKVLQDISGEHDGQEIELSLGYSWMAAGFELYPELSLTWMSEKTVNYFYEVSTWEALDNRPVYSPGSGFEVGVGFIVQRALFENFTTIALFEINTFDNQITDSPLVDKDYEFGSVLGVMYTF